MIEPVQPRRGFPRLLGSTSGEAAGMGPSAARLSRAPGSALANGPTRLREPRPDADATQPAPGLDTSKLSERYGRASDRLGRDGVVKDAGPANGRLSRDPADRTAGQRPSREIADPIAARDPSARLGNANQPPVAGSAADKPSTLRDRAFANPKRARNAVRNHASGGGPTGSAADVGVNYSHGWSGGLGGVINYGCWDDGWSPWFNWCNNGHNSWGPSCHPHSWWYSHCGWYWPFGYSFWWWSSCWAPYTWYSCYTPASVVVYRDSYPSTVYVTEAPPAYAPAGEGVIDDSADGSADASGDAGGRVVDESMDRLTSPTAMSATRTATQNLTMGDAAFREGRYGDAVHFYARAIEFQPDQGVLYLVLSDALFATGDYHYGAYALRKALELDPSLVENPVDKHGFYTDPMEFDRQLAVLEIYLRDRPTDQDARLLLAANYLFGLRPAAAVDLLETPAGESLRKTPSGLLLLEAARKQQYDAAKDVITK